MMTPRRSSGCDACIPELTTRRDRGRSQAPWTIVMLVRKPSQSIHTSRETYTFRRRSRMPCVFLWAPLLVGDTVEVVSSATSSTEFASTSLSVQHIRSCRQQTVCSTNTNTSTKLNCLQTSSRALVVQTSMDVAAGVTQEEGHTGFLIHLLSAVHALIFLARRIQPFLSLVDREVEFCVLTIFIVLHPLGIFILVF